MPIYEYKCENCGKIIEVFQRGAKQENPQENPIVCSDCGSTNLTRLFSVPGMVRMGSSVPEGTTCCGRTERCEAPPCSTDGVCERD